MKGQILTPPHSGLDTPKRILMKLGMYSYVVGMTTSTWRCDNVGGLGERVLVSWATLFLFTYFWDHAQHAPFDGF